MHPVFCNAVHCTLTVRTNKNLPNHHCAKSSVDTESHVKCTVFVYRCPNTGQQVQGWTDDPLLPTIQRRISR
jgi:hypothetical protein